MTVAGTTGRRTRILRRLKREDGMSIAEVMIAMLILAPGRWRSST